MMIIINKFKKIKKIKIMIIIILIIFSLLFFPLFLSINIMQISFSEIFQEVTLELAVNETHLSETDIASQWRRYDSHVG